jgi:alpha-D-ribose 1-methylphosphonate 5-phosphate C-P lyase
LTKDGDLVPDKQAVHPGYNFAFLDEQTKKEIRRRILKAVAVPGYQVPFASRELPIAQGWGTGGLQLTLALVGPDDVVKVIDQGSDDVVNAVNIRRLLLQTTGVKTTEDTGAATLIQTRHRIPEERLCDWQTLVLQVPYPEPLRNRRKMCGPQSAAWLVIKVCAGGCDHDDQGMGHQRRRGLAGKQP